MPRRSPGPTPRSGGGRSARSSKSSTPLVELDRLRRTGVGESADELRILAEVFEHAPGEHALRREHEVEVLDPRSRPEVVWSGGFQRSRVVPTGSVVSYRRGCRGVRCSPQRVSGGVHPSEVGTRLGVDEERHHEHDGIGAGYGVRIVGRRAQATGRNELGELLLQVGFAGEGLDCPAFTSSTVREVDVDTDDVVTLRRELHREGESDLAQGDDGDLHRFALFFWWSGDRPGRPVTSYSFASRARRAT